MLLPHGSHVYTGVWVDWSHGRVLGATLTLSQRDGGLLTSFIAAFVTFVSAQLWRILSFSFHQSSASKGPQDGVHHQRQAIFRNVQTPGGAAWAFVEQWRAWRKVKGTRPFARTFPWALVAILYLALFTALATFSSEVSKAASDFRLVQSPNCGYWNADPTTDQGFVAYSQWFTDDSLTAANYARSCYTEQRSPIQCTAYAKPSLSWTHEDTACPFGDDICVSDAKAYRMTSSVIDSHNDLGINAQSNRRVQFQKVTTCAPLKTKAYIKSVNGTSISETLVGAQILYYLYGPAVVEEDGTIVLNYTYVYNTNAVEADFAYSLSAIAALGKLSPAKSVLLFPILGDSIRVLRNPSNVAQLTRASASIRWEQLCACCSLIASRRDGRSLSHPNQR